MDQIQKTCRIEEISDASQRVDYNHESRPEPVKKSKKLEKKEVRESHDMDTLIRKTDRTLSQEQTMRKNAAVYTPEPLSDYLIEKTIHYVSLDAAFNNINKISIGDPACGDGALLQSMATSLSDKKRIAKIFLCGLDIDGKAVTSCRRKLGKFDARFKTMIVDANSLYFFENAKNKTLIQIRKNFSFDNGFDLIIANPPWGADLTDYKEKLDSVQYATLSGQVNSFELFIELATKIVRRGGYFAFIVPDSILNHGKSVLRDMLVESTEIKFIARLGEKIFPKINRACAIMICKNSPPSKTAQIDCFRLSSRSRSQILTGFGSFLEAEKNHIHTVPQKRFANNANRQFDIDLRETETTLVQKFQKSSKVLGDMLSCTRGVELGSSGMISACPNCQIWSPLSKTTITKCKSCGKIYSIRDRQASITSRKKMPNSKPLITGSDLKRYVAKPSKWIMLGKKGINYKSKAIFESPKILVRKTGVGITATLDYTQAYTNQVVYILRSNNKSNPDLEFFIALINSRAYYFFLTKVFGELEWKSHPYLTQSQILGLPLPDLRSEKNNQIIKEIVLLLQTQFKNRRLPKHIDIKIESLIGKMFAFTKEDYRIIFNAINELDELLPVKELKTFDCKEILDMMDG